MNWRKQNREKMMGGDEQRMDMERSANEWKLLIGQLEKKTNDARLERYGREEESLLHATLNIFSLILCTVICQGLTTEF